MTSSRIQEWADAETNGDYIVPIWSTWRSDDRPHWELVRTFHPLMWGVGLGLQATGSMGWATVGPLTLELTRHPAVAPQPDDRPGS